MPYILLGTKSIMEYWRILGRPCSKGDMAHAIKVDEIHFTGPGQGPETFKAVYGETEAQNLAAVMGTTVANISLSGDQILT